MDNTLKKFLEFNGNNIYFVSVEGTWWVAVKPICEALNVHYPAQKEALRKSKMLGQLVGTHRLVAKDGKLREMVCLPEKYVYGWIFQIQSDSPELEEYKWKCYELLHDHFHGALMERHNYLKEKTIAQKEMERAEFKLRQTEEFKKVMDLKDKHNKLKKELKRVDMEDLNFQLTLWGLEDSDN